MKKLKVKTLTFYITNVSKNQCMLSIEALLEKADSLLVDSNIHPEPLLHFRNLAATNLH